MRTVIVSLLLASPAAAADHRWQETGPPRQWALYRAGRQVGTWLGDKYYPFDAAARSWGAATDPPVPPPAADHFGVEADQLKADATRYTVNGRPATRDQVEQAVRQGVPDDAGKLRLTVIGPDAERKRVLDDWAAHPALQGCRESVLARDYPPDHWAVARAGFAGGGRPTIYLQAADGRVLHRQDEYRGPEQLAEAIRKARPDYDPARDPDATARATWPDWPPWAWLLAGAAAVFLGRPVLPDVGRLAAWVRDRLTTRPQQPAAVEELLRQILARLGDKPPGGAA
jgi:hypothetical protein